METLAGAKEALMAWAVTHPDTPGLLPFPDRNDDVNPDGDLTPDYDGTADCVNPGPVAAGHLLGRFPFRGEEQAVLGCEKNIGMSVEVVDGAGERLWYAVSQNLVRGGGGGLINPDIGELGAHSWITLRDAEGNVIANPDTGQALRIAAVIIAPGAALGGQDRSGLTPAAANYLDSFVIGATTYNNADFDGCPDFLATPCVATPGEEFIINASPAAGDKFNDRLVFITVDELMGAVEDRVLGDAALALKSYRDSLPITAPFYPWLAPFSNPRAPQGLATGGSATTLVDTGANFGTAGVLPGDLVRNVTDGRLSR